MAEKIHLNQPLTARRIIEILEKNPDLKKITCPISLYHRTSKRYLEALEELGVEVEPVKRIGRPRKYTEKDVKMVQSLLREGKTPKQISGITNIPLKTVYYLKGDMKLKRGKKKKYDKNTRFRVREMAKNGVPARKISEELGIPLRTVYYILKNG
ncbi:helix-turn-helix domain-containing protein [Methanothermobacter sp.]|uniref:helix-turn-helix domain-containing protein n=1 Tax=Methanothermobacter sp. TaxID=1884223 RepID=UPI00260D849B|nr:helix-turn-helix domain-containing protein [Methanothermobacter sp.]MDI9617458.1 helix-turn-helix domain-containing protein [Methanothermobacter sp.]